MKGLICAVVGLLAVCLLAAPAQIVACDNISQQVQFSTFQAYSAPSVVLQEVAVPVQTQVVQRQVVQHASYPLQTQFITTTAAVGVPQVQFLEVGCSRAGCSRAAIRGPRVQRSVQRVRTRG